MWLKLAQQMANYREIASPPRSEWIARVEFDNNDPFDEDSQEDAEMFPEYVDGDLVLTTFNKDGDRKIYTYPDRNLQEYIDVANTGGHGFWDHDLNRAPFI